MYVGGKLAGRRTFVCVYVYGCTYIYTRKAQSKSVTVFAPFAVRDCAAGHGYIYVFEGVRLSRAIDVLRCYYVYIARGMEKRELASYVERGADSYVHVPFSLLGKESRYYLTR